MSRIKYLIFFILVLVIVLGIYFYVSKSQSPKLTIPTVEQIKEKENGLQTLPSKPMLPQ